MKCDCPGYQLLALDRRKVLQELVDGMPVFQVVDKVVYRDSRAGEHQVAAVHAGVAADDVRKGLCPVLTPVLVVEGPGKRRDR